MKYIKTYEAFNPFPFLKNISNSWPLTNPREIEDFCLQHQIRNYTINTDGTVDVDGDVEFFEITIPKMPLKFGKIYGDLIITNGTFTSLEGFPTYVGGYLTIQNNKNLKTLKGCPEEVGDSFFINHCPNLTSLQYGPKIVGGNTPKTKSGRRGDRGQAIYFYQGGWDPTFIPTPKGDYKVGNVGITDLKGCPQYIVGNFWCDYNYKLTSLEGAPESVHGDFSLRHTNMKSFKGGPKFIGGNFTCLGAKDFLDPYDLRNLELDGSLKLLRDMGPFEVKFDNSGDEFEHIKVRKKIDRTDANSGSLTPPPVFQLASIFRNFEEFQMSLDYKYLEKEGNQWYIDEEKMEEALNEFDLPLNLINLVVGENYKLKSKK